MPPPIENSAAAPPRNPVSLLQYSPGLVLLAIAIADLWNFADPDLWGHVHFGEDALRVGHFAWHDHFSYTAGGRLFLDHEWLTDIIMGALYQRMGGFGLKLMKLACAVLTIVPLAAALGETGAPPMIQFALLGTVALIAGPQIQYRPQLFTFALLSILLYLLVRDVYRKPAPLWLAIPILALWANLHGGFILGIAALWTYAVVIGAQDAFAKRGAARALRLGTLAALSTLATLATPYGIGNWLGILHALSNPYTRTVVEDWQPLLRAIAINWRHAPFHDLNLEMTLGMMAALAIAVFLTPREADLPLAAIAAVMSAAAFAAVRNTVTAAIAIAAPLARHLPLALSRRWPSRGLYTGADAPASRTGIALIAAVTFAIFWRFGFFSGRIPATDPYPAGACKFFEQHRLNGNILGNFAWGDYLIWHLAPDSKVFMDGRYDTVYSLGVIADFLNFTYDRPGGDNALAKYPTDFVLISPELAARKLMDSQPGWRLIYRDKVSRLYARADSPAAHIPGLPVAGETVPATFP